MPRLGSALAALFLCERHELEPEMPEVAGATHDVDEPWIVALERDVAKAAVKLYLRDGRRASRPRARRGALCELVGPA